MPKTEFLSNALLNHYLAVSAFTAPSTVTVALSSTAPTKAGSNLTEPSGGWYSRQTATFSSAASESTANSAEIDFGNVGAEDDELTITHFALFSGSDMLAFGALTQAKTLNTGDAVLFPVGELTVSES